MLPKRWIYLAIYTPLILGLCIFYINYLYIRYTDNLVVELPTPNYKSHYQTCLNACKVIDKQHCQEWFSIPDKNICQYTCDSYIDQDTLTYSPEWIAIFHCVEKATSPKELQACKISCRPMEEL